MYSGLGGVQWLASAIFATKAINNNTSQKSTPTDDKPKLTARAKPTSTTAKANSNHSKSQQPQPQPTMTVNHFTIDKVYDDIWVCFVIKKC